MTATLLVIHVLLAIGLVIVILLQRSSADGTGLTGGSSGMGGMMTARGTANFLTRTTSIMATAFIVTSILLTIIGGSGHRPTSIADEIKTAPAQDQVPAAPTGTTGGAGVDTPAQSMPQQSVPAVPMSK